MLGLIAKGHFCMAETFQFTDPSTHPRFVREQRQITAILAHILVESGRSEPEALREAEALLTHSASGRAKAG